MADVTYERSRVIGLNILFTIPNLVTTSPFCTIEFFTPLKYQLNDHCYHGPITGDKLALLRCQQTDYVLHKDLLDKCFCSDFTFVCPRHILKVVNDTSSLGLPWHKDSKFVFSC